MKYLADGLLHDLFPRSGRNFEGISKSQMTFVRVAGR